MSQKSLSEVAKEIAKGVSEQDEFTVKMMRAYPAQAVAMAQLLVAKFCSWDTEKEKEELVKLLEAELKQL